MNHLGNQMMLLEHTTKIQNPDKHHDNTHDDNKHNTHTVTGRCDPLKNAREPKPITIHNKYNALSDGDDSESDSDDELQNNNVSIKYRKRYGNPNRRQRRQRKLQANLPQHKKCECQTFTHLALTRSITTTLGNTRHPFQT